MADLQDRTWTAPGPLGPWWAALRTRAPLLPPAAGLIVGAVVDQHLTPAPEWYLAVCAAVLAALFVRVIRRRFGAALVLLAAIGLGGLMHFNHVRKLPRAGIERYVAHGPCIARVRGTVIDEPRLIDPPEGPFSRWIRGGYRTNLLLRAESIEGADGAIPVIGELRVTVREAVLDLRAGERVEIHGRLYPRSPPTNPGGFNWSRRDRRHGIVAGMATDHRESVNRLALGDPGQGPIAGLRESVRSMLTDDLATASADETSLLEAMILGHRSRLARRIDDLFTRAGCVHFLAVSGIHVVIVMLFARIAGQVLMVRPRTRVWMMMIAIVAYALIAEPRPPILRAAIIALIFCVACLIGRQRTCMNWIAASAIVISIIDPASPFGIGWQLSFVAVLGVSYLMPILGVAPRSLLAWARSGPAMTPELQTLADDLAATEPPKRGLARVTPAAMYLWKILAVSLAAWIATAPLVAYHFHRLQPWGPINSLIVLPAVMMVMALGFAKVLLAGIVPGLDAWVAHPLTFVDETLIAIVDRLGELPGATMFVRPPSLIVMAAYYAALALICLRFHLRLLHAGRILDQEGPPARPRFIDWRSLAAVVVILVSATMWLWPAGGSGSLTITVLDVGAGSATVIELPDGSVNLYDAGTAGPRDVGAGVIVPFLRQRGIRRIDRVYVTHPNLDHFSGIPTLIEHIETGPIIVTDRFAAHAPPESPAGELLRILQRKGHPLEILGERDDSWDIAGVRFDRLWPAPGYTDLDANDTSLVLRVSYLGHRVLMTGDIEDRPQRALIDRSRSLGDSCALTADVLFAPHHGSVRPSTAEFFKETGAHRIVRSSNQPIADTTNGLIEIVGDRALYNTADHGAIQIVIDKRGIIVTTMTPDSP
jgi:competence protein ComEC